MKQRKGWRISCDVGKATSQLIVQPFRRFTYVRADSPNPSVASPTSQLVLQPFFRISYVTGSSLTSPGVPNMQYCHRYSSILDSCFGVTYSPTFQKLYLRPNTFLNPPVAFPTSEFILEPFRCFTYVTAHSPTLFSLHLASRPCW